MPAAIGFALRPQGVSVDSLTVENYKGRDVIVATKSDVGRDATSALSDALPQFIANLRFEKSMRWNSTGVTFSRPIRWLLAIHGERVVPFVFADIIADRMTPPTAAHAIV